MKRHTLAASYVSTTRQETIRLLSLFALSTLLTFAVLAPSARADSEVIAEFGSGAGQVRRPAGVSLKRSSGDLYVADEGNSRIDEFGRGGAFGLSWGWSVRDGVNPGLQTCGPQALPPTNTCFQGHFGPGAGEISPTGVAVDQNSGAVYVPDNSFRRVSKFSSDGEFVYMVGRNVNKTKKAEAGATQAEKDVCTAASGDTCGSGEDGTGPDEFSNSITNIAVSSTGLVWVGDLDRLTSFDGATGAASGEVALPGAGYTQSLALDSTDNFYVVSSESSGVHKLEVGTGSLLATLDAGGQARTVTVDGSDNVYVGDSSGQYHFNVYDAAGEQKSQFGAGQVIGMPGAANIYGGNALAVDESAAKLYVASTVSEPSVVQAFDLPEPGPLPEKQHVEALLPTTVTLAASLNPEGFETEYHFDWGTTEAYGSGTAAMTLPSSGFDAEAVEAQLSGLIPETTYHFRLVATNHCNSAEPAEECTVAGPDTAFTTPPAVLVEPEWATDVGAHSAAVHADINPLGVEAEAWLEYGTDEGYGHVVPLANPGSGFAPVEREVLLRDLQAATTYHYRFAARDERDGATYTVHGADRTFTTQFGGLGFELADGRVWEMVSPPDKHGARITGGFTQALQARSDGDGLAYPSYLSTEADPEGNRIFETSMNLARRSADGSWHSKDITTPNGHVEAITEGFGNEYKLFSPDLSQALLTPRSGTPLSPEAPEERTVYLRENGEPAKYTPLFTNKEPYANVSVDTKLGGLVASGDLEVMAATPDFSHVIVKAEQGLALFDGAPPGGIYEWANGQVTYVNVPPPGESSEQPRFGSSPSSIRGAISNDGSRVFWANYSAGEPAALFVRDTEAEEGARLDVVQPGGSGIGSAAAMFQGANTAGTVVFFRDSQQLTEGASSKGFDLYRCEIPSGDVASGCATLTDLTALAGGAENADMQGLAPSLSDDGSTIYLVAKGVLDEEANEFGDSAVPGQPNLYLWQAGSGVRFIATLAAADRLDWTELHGELSAAASPSGRYLGFMSQRSLTGYDNRDKASGESAEEVFRYDALTHHLACVSCNPSSARPYAPTRSDQDTYFDPRHSWSFRHVAAILPEATTPGGIDGPPLYRPRAVLDDGRVFFNAIDPLVPADSNGKWDVYQYEPTGVGDCLGSSSGSSVARSPGGCTSLISSGTAEEDAGFVDASETGDDAFFWTSAQLSVTDEDREVDIYDARVDGIAATLPVSSECLGEACQPLAQAPNDPTPASSAFDGPGNVKPSTVKRCPKGKRRVQRHGKTRCVAKKPRHHHRHQQHRTAGTNRRAGR